MPEDKETVKRPVGRPSEYKPEYCDQIIDYFTRDLTKEITVKKVTKDGDAIEETKEVGNELPLLCGFAAEIGVHRDTIHTWSTKHPEFADAIKKCKELQEEMIINGAMLGHYDRVFSIFLAKNVTGMRDKQEVEVSGKVTLVNALESLGADDDD